MSHLAANLKKIRSTEGLTQTAFANRWNITRAAVSSYEEGRAQPKTPLLLQIAKHYNLDITDLLETSITVNQIQGFPSDKLDLSLTKASKIPFVSFDELPQYQEKHEDKTYLQSLPHIELPFIYAGVTRAFELEKDIIRFCKRTQSHQVDAKKISFKKEYWEEVGVLHLKADALQKAIDRKLDQILDKLN